MNTSTRAIVAAVAATLVLPLAALGPVQASTGTIHIPRGFYDLRSGPAGTFLLNAGDENRGKLRMVNPVTNTITHTWLLNSAPGDFAVGRSSVWVAMYFDNTVERIDPATGRATATVRVGLQPESVLVAFGSVWVANHHGASVTRIDPHNNRVIATIPAGNRRTFYGGPQELTADAHHVYVGASNGETALTVINPRSNRVLRRPGTPAQFCGETIATGEAVWSADLCTDTLYRLNTFTGKSTFTQAFGKGEVLSMTSLRGSLWVSYDAAYDQNTQRGSMGTIEELNPVTGAREKQIVVGGDADVLRTVNGQLWVVDDTHGTVRHLNTG